MTLFLNCALVSPHLKKVFSIDLGGRRAHGARFEPRAPTRTEKGTGTGTVRSNQESK